MNYFKLSVLTLLLSFSMSVMAADNTENLADTDKDLNRPSAGDTIKLRDCSSRSGNDKMLCEKENRTRNPNAMSNDRRNNTLRDDMRSRDLNNRRLDIQNPNSNTRNMQSRDNQARESYPSDTGSSATQPNGSNSMNSTTGEMRPNAPPADTYRPSGSGSSRSM